MPRKVPAIAAGTIEKHRSSVLGRKDRFARTDVVFLCHVFMQLLAGNRFEKPIDPRRFLRQATVFVRGARGLNRRRLGGMAGEVMKNPIGAIYSNTLT
jgi:hypothetical protein